MMEDGMKTGINERRGGVWNSEGFPMKGLESFRNPKDFEEAGFGRPEVPPIEYNKTVLNRLIGMSIIDRRKFYENQICINQDEYNRAMDINGNEAKSFIKQFSELGISIHCILKPHVINKKIEKEDASAIIPENFIVEPRKSFTEPRKKDEPKMEKHVGKIKRSSYISFLHS